ncbi:MAG TPA: substrate-binding domain-containing protein, partial [Polyangiaceae bacterium]|nr:substrate-binding domain-containing protein [Polyangiaceae bacterium]
MKKHLVCAALALACQRSEPAPEKDTAAAKAPAAPEPAATAPSSAGARDYITIVGSSTVYPFATVAAEQFGKSTKFKAPKVESTGTGGGLKLFCDGVGVKFPDIANASRRIKDSEVAQCKQNGVAEIVELKIGYDGIVLANSKQAKPLVIDLHHLWLAL